MKRIDFVVVRGSTGGGMKFASNTTVKRIPPSAVGRIRVGHEIVSEETASSIAETV